MPCSTTLNTITNAVIAKAKRIKLLIMDVDGVLTNGQLIYSEMGENCKIFNVRDGLGIKLLQKINIKTAIITSRCSQAVTCRMNELNVDFIFQNQHNKTIAYEELLRTLAFTPDETAYIGDDLPDLTLIKRSGLGVAVADGSTVLKDAAAWVTTNKGGMGAVRELADLIIAAQNRDDEIIRMFS